MNHPNLIRPFACAAVIAAVALAALTTGGGGSTGGVAAKRPPPPGPASKPDAAKRPNAGSPEDHPGVFPNRADNISPAERREAVEFIRAHMPNLFAMWDESDPVSPGPMFRRQRTWILAIAHFHQKRYADGKRDFPDEEQHYLDDAKMHDDAIGMLRDLAGTGDKDGDAVRAKVAEKMRHLTESVLAERRKRLVHIREEWERQQRLLVRDEKRVDDLVAKNVEGIERNVITGPRQPTSRPPQGSESGK